MRHTNPTLAAALAALRGEYSYTPHGAEDKPLPPRLAPWMLARTADCAAPDRDEEEGAAFLTQLFDAFHCCVENETDIAPDETDAGTLAGTVRELDWHETADGAVPVYTHRKWQTFTQLAAYEQDVSDLTSGLRKLTGEDVANAALYLIADRLLRALSDKLADIIEAQADETETDAAPVNA